VRFLKAPGCANASSNLQVIITQTVLEICDRTFGHPLIS
jgi:hypothetical protein